MEDRWAKEGLSIMGDMAGGGGGGGGMDALGLLMLLFIGKSSGRISNSILL